MNRVIRNKPCGKGYSLQWRSPRCELSQTTRHVSLCHESSPPAGSGAAISDDDLAALVLVDAGIEPSSVLVGSVELVPTVWKWAFQLEVRLGICGCRR